MADFSQSGSLKVLFPRSDDFQAVLLNTSGGVTGGDRFAFDAQVGTDSQLTVTTQAAERAYRAAHGTARITNRLQVQAGAKLHWLPQETILFEGCDLTRQLLIDIANDARLLMVEPLIFGRVASGEQLAAASFHDQISIRRNGALIYQDRSRLVGDVQAAINCGAIAAGATAMVNLVYIGSEAEGHLHWARGMLPSTGGVSLLAPDVLVLRLLAEDSFALRKTLLPILDRLSQNTLPKCWRL